MKLIKSSDIPQLRHALLKKQGGRCLVCNSPPKSPVLDHHHTKRIKGTGQIRGVLCRSCNVLLGKMENNCVRYGVAQNDLPKILRYMADYLELPHHPFLHPNEAPRKKILQKSSYNKLAKAIDRLKANTTNRKLQPPPYPKSGKLTKPLARLFDMLELEPEYYK